MKLVAGVVLAAAVAAAAADMPEVVPGMPKPREWEREKKTAVEKRYNGNSDGVGGLLCVYEKHEADGRVRIMARILAAR